ncbi:MAG: hypothetical protein Tsb002_26730 [Wenzhouxiangellaceae bacterium]
MDSVANYIDLPDPRPERPTYWDLWLGSVIYYSAWMVMTPLTMLWFHHKLRLPLNVARTLLLWLSATAVWWLVVAGYRAWVGCCVYISDGQFFATLASITAGEWFVIAAFSQGVIVFCMTLSAIRLANKAELDRAAVHQSLLTSELNILKSRFDPHFLMNALNTAAGLVRTAEREQALKSLIMLRDLLHNVLQQHQDDLAPFDKEIRFIETYLALQKLRFEHRLEWSISIDPECLAVNWPRLLLQPIVENAVQHGMDDIAGIEIKLEASCNQHQMCIELINSIGQDSEAEKGHGTGLEITRKRLEILYGGRATMEVWSETRFFRTKIVIPL